MFFGASSSVGRPPREIGAIVDRGVWGRLGRHCRHVWRLDTFIHRLVDFAEEKRRNGVGRCGCRDAHVTGKHTHPAGGPRWLSDAAAAATATVGRRSAIRDTPRRGASPGRLLVPLTPGPSPPTAPRWADQASCGHKNSFKCSPIDSPREPLRPHMAMFTGMRSFQALASVSS